MVIAVACGERRPGAQVLANSGPADERTPQACGHDAPAGTRVMSAGQRDDRHNSSEVGARSVARAERRASSRDRLAATRGGRPRGIRYGNQVVL